MVDKLSKEMSSGLNVTTILKQPKKLKSSEIINKTLYGAIALLLVAILSTFFVEEIPGFVLDFRSIAIDAVWIMAASYTIGELFKLIFINKAKATEEYAKAKDMAENALNSLTSFELEHRAEYCKAYSEDLYNRHLKRLLSNIDVTEEEYMEKYHLLNYRELKAKYGLDVPKVKLKELAKINHLKRCDYNPEFFSATIDKDGNLVPSQMYDEDKENRKNRITTAFTSMASGFFCVTFAGNFIFSFSIAALFMAIVKITSVIIFASLKANFGWNLVMKTSISKYLLKVREVKNLKHYCSKLSREKSNDTYFKKYC